MKKKVPLILTTLLLTLPSCGLDVDSSDKKMVVTDFKGREVSLKSDIEKVCISFNIEEYLAIGGNSAMSKVVGWSHKYWVNRREDALAAYSKVFPKFMEVDDIGYNDTISVEKIISLQPDVVLMSASVNYSYMEDKLPLLDAANIPVVFFDYHVDTKESIRKSNEILGKVLHQEERAKEISDFYDAKVDAVFDAVKDIKEEDRPNVYMEFSKGKDEYGNTWSKKMWGSLIGQCGGKNVAYDVSDANSVDLAKEAIIANNPDVIIFTGALQNGLTGNIVLGYNQDEENAKEMLATYLEREEWQSLNAVKNRALSAVYHDLSRHVFDFAGVEFLAKQIQPSLFTTLDPYKDLQEFFTKFMPFSLEGCFMVTL
jgi:iron complex transport system substrate-binding protein